MWRRKDGGFRVRGRVVDSKTGKLREVNRAFPECKRAREVATNLEGELAQLRAGGASAPSARPRFDEWSATVFERKVRCGPIVSVRGREKWEWCLRVHLIPAFGSIFIDS